jgi:phage gp37-like protein
MRIDQITRAILQALQEEVPSLRVVEPHDGPIGADIEKMPIRLPAVYVVHNDSKYEAVCLATSVVRVRFSVYLVTRPQGLSMNGKGASWIMEEVRGALSGRSFGLEMEGLRPIGVSLVLKRDSLLVNRLILEAGFESHVDSAEAGVPAIRTAHMNILESSTVSLPAGIEDIQYPLYRLYDRNISRPFRAASEGTLEVLVDQGNTESPRSVDTLIIPTGHNLDGLSLGLWHSDDGVSYLEAIPEWTATATPIVKNCKYMASRYWKLVIDSPSLVPSMPEMFLTSAYEWERMPLLDASPHVDFHNLVSRASSDGRQRFLRAGPDRRRRSYSISRCPSAMRDEMLALWETWGEGKPFWLCDHEGQWIYGGLESEPGLGETAAGSYALVFDFMEALS